MTEPQTWSCRNCQQWIQWDTTSASGSMRIWHHGGTQAAACAVPSGEFYAAPPDGIKFCRRGSVNCAGPAGHPGVCQPTNRREFILERSYTREDIPWEEQGFPELRRPPFRLIQPLPELPEPPQQISYLGLDAYDHGETDHGETDHEEGEQ